MQPAAFDEQIRQGGVLARGPQGASLDELRGVDQARLQGQHAEQKVAIRVHAMSGLNACS